MPAMQSNAAVATLRDPAQEITIRAVAASWVEIIRSDGESVMTKLMRAGDSYVVDSSSKFYLSTGNAGGLVVILGDETPRPMGKSGEIIRDMPLISINCGKRCRSFCGGNAVGRSCAGIIPTIIDALIWRLPPEQGIDRGNWDHAGTMSRHLQE